MISQERSPSQGASGLNMREAWPIIKVAFREGCMRPPPPVFDQSDSVSELRAPGSSQSRRERRTGRALTHVFAHFSFPSPNPPRVLSDAACKPSTRREHTSDGRAMDSLGSRCKIVVVGDTQCGKTALLHVFAKDCYPEVRL